MPITASAAGRVNAVLALRVNTATAYRPPSGYSTTPASLRMVGRVPVLPDTRTSSKGKPEASRCGHTCSPSSRRSAAHESAEAASSRQIAASSRVISRGVLRLVSAGSSTRSRASTTGSASSGASAAPSATPASAAMSAARSRQWCTTAVRVRPRSVSVRLTSASPSRSSSASAAPLSDRVIARNARSRRDRVAASSMAPTPVVPPLRSSGRSVTASAGSTPPASATRNRVSATAILNMLAVATSRSAPTPTCAAGRSRSTACSQPVTPASVNAARSRRPIPPPPVCWLM